MRVIQSFWSCKQDLLRYRAGWLAPEYHFMSWALSSCTLSKYYSDLTLYTDRVGAKLLIDELRLPYKDVVCNLDSLEIYPANLWALPKIRAYCQEAPFLHVDGDVYIWGGFAKELLESKIIAQNVEESINDHYENTINTLRKQLRFIPPEIVEGLSQKRPIRAFNAGIFGGSDIEFIRDYSKKALEFVDKNLMVFDNVSVSNFNIIFEQYLLYTLVTKQQKSVGLLFDEVMASQHYAHLGEFKDVPYKKKYLHLSGNFKTDLATCTQLGNRLREDFPEFYYRIISLCKSKKVMIFKDYFWFFSDTTEETLLAVHRELKGYEESKLEDDFISTSKDSSNTSDNLEQLSRMLPSIVAKEFAKFIRTFRRVLRKFGHIERMQLLQRDIVATSFNNHIFRSSLDIFDKVLVRASSIEVIESKVNWATVLDCSNSSLIQNIDLLECHEESFYLLMVPECDSSGFSLHLIDELDRLILDSLATPTTIRSLLGKLREAFNGKESDNFDIQYQDLIFERLKYAILNKSITLSQHIAPVRKPKPCVEY
jgi:hypothetical protein